MGTLGHRVFEPLVSVSATIGAGDSPATDEPLLYFKNANAKATGRRTSEGFVVLKDSIISQKISKSCPEIAIRARAKYNDKIDANYTLTDDVLLSSPSTAAAFVGGSSLSGNELWKTKNGVLLKNIN